MQFDKYIKGLVFGLVVSSLAACSSNQTASDTETTEQTKVEQTAATTESETATGVEMGSAEQQVGAEDQQQALQQQQQLQAESLLQENVVLFDFDKSDIRSEFIDLLEAHAAYLRDNPTVSVLIEGHTDERGTPAYNIALGEKRAKAVARYLQSLGVMSSQISTVSYGEEKPVDTSHTEAGMAENRRAVLVY